MSTKSSTSYATAQPTTSPMHESMKPRSESVLFAPEAKESASGVVSLEVGSYNHRDDLAAMTWQRRHWRPTEPKTVARSQSSAPLMHSLLPSSRANYRGNLRRAPIREDGIARTRLEPHLEFSKINSHSSARGRYVPEPPRGA